MEFLKYDLGYVDRGAIVSVTLSTGANVRLMSSSDLGNYERGQRHSYYGGLISISPFRIAVPSSGWWYVTVDLAGLRATSVNAGVAVERRPATQSYAAPTRDRGYYSRDRGNGDFEYFIGRDGDITAERPHVHVIHSQSENRIVIVGTHTDGTKIPEEVSLPFDSSWREVDDAVATVRRLLI